LRADWTLNVRVWNLVYRDGIRAAMPEPPLEYFVLFPPIQEYAKFDYSTIGILEVFFLHARRSSATMDSPCASNRTRLDPFDGIDRE
jgi:hypothetical protein